MISPPFFMRAITGGNTAFFISSSMNFRLLFFILEYIFLVGKQGAIPYSLPLTSPPISLLPAPQLDVKRTIWRGL